MYGWMDGEGCRKQGRLCHWLNIKGIAGAFLSGGYCRTCFDKVIVCSLLPPLSSAREAVEEKRWD